MKISKTRKNKVIREIGCIIICYLLALFGVNGIVNPVFYFDSWEKNELSTEYTQEYLRINLDETNYGEGFLNVNISRMDTFSFSIDVLYVMSNDEKKKVTIQLDKGINSFSLDKLDVQAEYLLVPLNKLEENGIQIDDINWSSHKQIDKVATTKIFFSFLCITVFYSVINWVKNSYTK